ncbi:MAG TPA: hypothetical protein VK641_06130, partial [Terriglobales bacterium]|nr:hypothetical protein [Terriglobales bacterium]
MTAPRNDVVVFWAHAVDAINKAKAMPAFGIRILDGDWTLARNEVKGSADIMDMEVTSLLGKYGVANWCPRMITPPGYSRVKNCMTGSHAEA